MCLNGGGRTPFLISMVLGPCCCPLLLTQPRKIPIACFLLLCYTDIKRQHSFTCLPSLSTSFLPSTPLGSSPTATPSNERTSAHQHPSPACPLLPLPTQTQLHPLSQM